MSTETKEGRAESQAWYDAHSYLEVLDALTRYRVVEADLLAVCKKLLARDSIYADLKCIKAAARAAIARAQGGAA